MSDICRCSCHYNGKTERFRDEVFWVIPRGGIRTERDRQIGGTFDIGENGRSAALALLCPVSPKVLACAVPCGRPRARICTVTLARATSDKCDKSECESLVALCMSCHTVIIESVKM